MTEGQAKATKAISFSEMRKEGRRISRTNGKARTFLLIEIIIYAIFCVIGFSFGIIAGITGLSENIIFDQFMNILGYAIEILSTLGIISIGLELINGINAEIKDYFKAYTRDRIRKYLLGTILLSAIISLGIVCLIIPGIIAAVRLKFTLYTVIDKGLDPVEAIKYSRNIAKGHFREIIGFEFYFLFFNIIGMLCLIVGLIRTGPMAQLATARYYKLLSEIYEEKEIKTNKKSNNISM